MNDPTFGSGLWTLTKRYVDTRTGERRSIWASPISGAEPLVECRRSRCGDLHVSVLGEPGDWTPHVHFLRQLPLIGTARAWFGIKQAGVNLCYEIYGSPRPGGWAVFAQKLAAAGCPLNRLRWALDVVGAFWGQGLRRRECATALGCANHPRLGEGSPAAKLDGKMLRRVGKYIKPRAIEASVLPLVSIANYEPGGADDIELLLEMVHDGLCACCAYIDNNLDLLD